MRKLTLLILLLFPQLPACYEDESTGKIVTYQGILTAKEHRHRKPAGTCEPGIREKFVVAIRRPGFKKAIVFESDSFPRYESNIRQIKEIYYGFNKGDTVIIDWKIRAHD